MITFLLPVYNEEKNIEKLLEDITSFAKKRGLDFSICISDDGSTDGTVQKVRALKAGTPVEIVSNPVNMGPGAAFDRGFRHILKSCKTDDIVVTLEGDNTSDLASLDNMLKEVRSGADLVLASCYAREGKVEGLDLYRRILSIGANFLMKMFSRNKKINTFSSFYRCYKASALLKGYEAYGDKFIEEKGFICAVDIFLKLQRLDIRIVEVPITLKCHMRVGRSKMKTIKTTLSYLKLFTRETCRGNVYIGSGK